MSVSLLIKSFALPVLLVAAFASSSVFAQAAKEVQKDAAKPAAAKETAPPKATLPPPPAPPANPRAAHQEKIANDILNTMVSSNDPRALALSARFARTVGVATSEERSKTDQDARQEAQLAKALALIEKPEHKNAEGFVRFMVATYCVALPEQKMCAAKNRLDELANSQKENAVPWIMQAANDFAKAGPLTTQIFLDRAAAATTSNWYYGEAVAVAFDYAKRATGADPKFADAAVVAFAVGGETSIPEFRRFSQMCNPDAEGKLPTGRYEACRKVANVLMKEGRTNVEMIVGLRAMERMATGENKTEEAKAHSDALTKFQGEIGRLWKEGIKFPPVSSVDSERLNAYVSDLATVGERQATINAQKKFLSASAPAAATPAPTK